MKKRNLKKQVLILLLSMVIIVSCKKETSTKTTFKDDSPAYHIEASEAIIIPAAIELPDNSPEINSRVATFYAEGVQKYKAQQVPGSDPATYRWLFVAPKADLFDISNSKVGTHSIGPTWQLSGADSIYAQQFYPARSVSPDSTGIAWLLLKTKEGKIPTGFFAGVSYIQRIATTGGIAPAIPPTAATDTIDVKYTAVYRFSKITR